MHRNLAVVFEGAPEAGNLMRGATTLWVDNADASTPDLPGLSAMLKATGPGVREVRLMPSSRVRDYGWLRCLKALDTLRIETPELGDLGKLNQIHSLRSLVILVRKRSLQDFSPVSSLPIKMLSVERPSHQELQCIANNGSIEQLLIADSKLGNLIDMPLPHPRGACLKLIYLNADMDKFALSSSDASKLDFRMCKKLQRVSSQGATAVSFSTCRQLDLDTLVLPSVRELQILNGGTISSFDFCAGCQELRHLLISQGRIDTSLLSLRKFRLKSLFISGVVRVRGEDLFALSQEMPDCVITNGDVCYLEGAEVPVTMYYERASGF